MSKAFVSINYWVWVQACSVLSDSLWPPWMVAPQTAFSMECSRQEYWSGLPFPIPNNVLTKLFWRRKIFKANLCVKTSGGEGIPVELFQILKDDYMEVLHSIRQQIWKPHLWLATRLEKGSFHSNPNERQCQRMLKLPHNCIHLTR